jgi:hypothetical protein
MAGLTGFQRNSVEHVIERFYGPDRAKRFLIADETGLGKTMVARGVIARTIEKLEHDPTVDRIDIVYVCSNTDIAHQNLKALDVTGDEHHGIASRLTLLAKHSRHLTPLRGHFSKPVNLISFTPGTSFEGGWQTGKSEERAMLYLLLESRLKLQGRRATAAGRILQGGVNALETFQRTIEDLRWELEDDIDDTVEEAFLAAALREGLLEQFERLMEEIGQRRSLPEAMSEPVRKLIGKMRSALAHESVRLLEPDLVILDEFQRFRDLLDPGKPAGELAHHLFDHHQARVLLLSATPYKPFTYAEEASAGEDHHINFMETINFLATPLRRPVSQQVADGLRRYREAVVTGGHAEDITEELREALLTVMTRAERPKSHGQTMGREILTPASQLPADDLVAYVHLRELARHVGGSVSIDYWKSAPYFANFMDGYKIADQVRAALSSAHQATETVRLLGNTQRLDPEALLHYRTIDMGNERLRQLAAETVDAGWWKLLWLPPSLPYLEPGGPYAEAFAQHVTKRLIFSSWTATPTAIASLLSYSAERETVEGSDWTERSPSARKSRGSRLTYNTDARGRPQSMTSLALFWPMPGLADIANPRAHCRGGGSTITTDSVTRAVADQVRPTIGDRTITGGTSGEASYWIETLGRADLPPELDLDDIVSAMTGRIETDDEDYDPDDQKNLARHVRTALSIGDRSSTASIAPDLAEVIAELAAHSPANIAYRALRSISTDSDQVTEKGLWQASAVLASGLRTLFARPETAALLDKLMPEKPPYWRAILRYCAWGNLQAVLDEYLHQLASVQRTSNLDDRALRDLALGAASVMSLRPAPYEAFNPDEPSEPIKLSARFALRYGSRKQDQVGVRQPQIRQAFNSPFWPFVLATTSVGQEGIDFHWWCHSLLHWNTPANPVDFEQREGRIDRYNGHAVRQNIAERHASGMRSSQDPNPWDAAYRLAEDEKEHLGEFAPHWVYPGSAHIERHLMPYALSIDEARLARIKRDVALYRLTFGQPRQEDMLELLYQHYDETDPEALTRLRLDLRAPGPAKSP